MKGKIALLVVATLLLGIFAVTFNVTVTASSTKTVDGDPSDWTGAAGADNTWAVSAGEGIWRDVQNDDTGNGSYIYPNVTHSSPAIPDSAGGPDGNAYAYTGYPHGGMVDLREFRVTGDDSNLYILLRFENMGTQEIAVEWNRDQHNTLSPYFPYANATGFGKILAQVYIDKDRVSGSGRTNATLLGNFEFDSALAWEAVIDIAGDVARGFPRVEFANGTTAYLNQTVATANPLQPQKAVYVQGNCDVYPAPIEMKVPYSMIGDPRGQAWRFMVVVGGFDEGIWRAVWNTTFAISWGWPPLFKFLGGEGGDWWTGPGQGNDPNIIDMAFTATQAEQEALLGSFSSLVKVSKYMDVTFLSNGDVLLPKRAIDGDPSDWTGTPGADNTWVESSGEGIWTDPYFDDTGNGSYIYPNVTHSSPPIPDSAGGPDGYAYAYTGYPHGGMVDLREFRVTGDDSNLYILLRFENMGSQAVAVEWNRDQHNNASPYFPYANASGFGKILAQVFIDKDGISGSGSTHPSLNDTAGNPSGNFLIDPSVAWEVAIDIAGDVARGFPRVEFANGTTVYLNQTVANPDPLQPQKAVYVQGNCDIYPSAIELKTPYNIIGDPREEEWRFIVVVGGFDEGIWRQVWNTTFAISWGWPPLFKFLGGEGADWWAGGMGNDPNIIDMAFTATQAEQEALLGSFSSLVVVDKYMDVTFLSNGDVLSPSIGGEINPIGNLPFMAPWIILAVIVIATAVSFVFYRKKHTTKPL